MNDKLVFRLFVIFASASKKKGEYPLGVTTQVVRGTTLTTGTLNTGNRLYYFIKVSPGTPRSKAHPCFSIKKK